MNIKTINKLLTTVIVIVCVSISSAIMSINSVQSQTVDAEHDSSVKEEIINISEGFGTYDNGLECYLAATAVLQQTTNYSIFGSGNINAKAAGINVKQNTKANITVDANGTYLTEDITKAASNFGPSGSISTYYDKERNIIKLRETEDISADLSVNYSAPFKEISKTDYISRYGYLPGDSKYIISSETIKSESNFKFDGEIYSFTLALKTNAAKNSYKIKIKNVGGASSLPQFSSCEINVKINKDGKFIETELIEKYSLTMGGILKANVTSYLKDEYKYYSEPIINSQI